MESQVESAAHSVVLSRTEAQLYVANVERSSEFFASRLGFEKVFVYGDPPFYAQVRRDNARLSLRLVCEAVFVGESERESISCQPRLRSIPRRRSNNCSLSSSFHQTVKKEPWGARNFIVLDPDGNLILFAGPAE